MNPSRRTFIVALAAMPALAWGKLVPRVAWLAPGTPENQGHYVAAFRQGMVENGLVEGRDYVLDLQYAEGHYERFPAMAETALKSDPAVVILVSIPSIRIVQKLTRTVPIVFISTTDPVGSGLVASLAKPGGNTTGVSNQAEDAATKYIELAREALPQARRLALLFNAGNTSNTRQFELMRGFARDRGMAVEPFGIRAPEELEQAFGSIARYRPDALVMVADSMLFDVHRRIAAFALKEMLPTIAPTPEHGEAGMLFAYGASRPEMYRRAAVYVKKILSGAKPADLPVEQPTRLELVVNLKTAAALRLKVPHGILLRADRVIE